MDSTLRRAAAAGLTLLVGLTACGGPPPEPTDVSSDVDRQRAHILASEPILAQAVSPPEVTVGLVHSSKVGWDRTEVYAELYETSGGTTPDPAAVEQEFARATAQLRQSDWTIHWAMCLPPPAVDPTGNLLSPVAIPVPVPRLDGYEWLVTAYKIADGVSYSALMVGVRQERQASVQILLRAPNARDNANLFPEPPAAVAADQTCAEDGRVGEDAEQAGTAVIMRDWWPFPAQTHPRDPAQV
jgi:hypothetical protein